MGQPAARLGDLHVCPIVPPHPPVSPVTSGCATVLIGGSAAARVGDSATCDVIATGSGSVLIGGSPAARLGDLCAHGGVIITGCDSVLIG
ncbi:MAG: PAAR domain-containing protein [Burkholderiaceae bacterium]|jgi:uncharacterized Zn-binding protein involved in type VI secretion|nr:PAAR domain-containing protein [Burkholderiaceae bacterium]